MCLDFDLEYAKLGLACGACKLITRSGRPAQINDWNYTREGYPLSGWIQKESGLVLPVTWTADLLFEMHQVIRHQLWLDTPEDERSRWTVDASEAMTLTDEPLIRVEQIKEK